MKSKPTIAARVLLGLVFFGIGLNGLLRLVPLPPAEGAAAVFISGLIASRYFFPLLFVTYLLTGTALLIGRFVPLALTALAPIIANVAVMHLFIPSSGAEICLAALVTVLELFLAWSYRAAFRPLLRAHYGLASTEIRSVAGEHNDREQALRSAQISWSQQ
jgi:putative oxidoreductase